MALRHNLSRRAVLGAAAVAPAILAGAGPAVAAAPALPEPHAPTSPAPQPPAVPAASRRRWDRALAFYRGAEGRLAAFRAEIESQPPEARAFPACEADEDRFDDLECARLDALRRLLRAPAPDLPALALKLGLVIDDNAWELTGAALCLAALRSDAGRLCGGGVSADSS